MTISARRLLRALDPLPFGARQKHLSDTARRLAGTTELDDLLRALNGDEFSRRTALQLAYVAGHREYVRECLSARETAVVRHALGAAIRLGLPAEVFRDRLPHLPPALRQSFYTSVRRRKASTLADALLAEVRTMFGDREAAALLPACSAPVVAASLPDLAHAVSNWSTIGRRHPVEFLDLVDAELASMTPAWWPRVWDRLGGGIAAAALPQPARVLDLVERTLPHAPLPWGLVDVLGVPARHSPDRVARLLLDPRRTGHTPDRRSLWRALSGIGEAELIGLARLLDGTPLVRFLHALPPSRRAAVYAGAVGGRVDVPLDALDELPTAAQAREARRLLTLRANTDEPSRRLAVTARLSWVEARPVLREATKRATANERFAAYPLYIAAGAASRDQEAFAEVLSTLTRLPNEQDPVRAAALTALAAVPSWLFRPSECDQLVKLMVDAAQARDCSWSTQHAVSALAGALIREGAVSRRLELLDAGMTGLEVLGRHLSWIPLGRLDRVLPRGAEHQVFEALRGRMAVDAERGRYAVLLALTSGLGKRAWDMVHLQELVARACSAKDDSVVSQAVELWLRPPATRDDRVERVFRGDRSTITLHPVRTAIGSRRTDLLDDVIGKPLHGRFLKRGVRHVPAFEGFHRWLPRQRAAYAKELAAVANDRSANVYERANAVRTLGRVPGTADVVRRFVTDREVQVVEAALSALAWTDEPADVLPDLLAHADTDRARVAVYAASRCARFTPPDRLGEQLGRLLAGRKVTARKEAIRLLAEHHVPGAAALLAAAWDGPHGHRDVRRALVSATRWFLDDEAAWDLLAKAAADEQAVAITVLDRSPFTTAPHHRARYAALVRTVVAAPNAEPAVLRAATLPLWTRWDDGITALLVDLVSDLGNTATWSPALTALLDVCGVADDIAPLRATAARLLAAGDRFDAEADRDLPARQRIGALARMVVDRRRSPVLRAAAKALSADLAAEHRRASVALAVAAVPWDDDALPQLREVARLADRPVLAEQAGVELAGQVDDAVRRLPRDRVRTIAETLAGEGPAAARLALAITSAAGDDTGWPEHWRSLLRALRRHDDPDVRLAALDTVTAPE